MHRGFYLFCLTVSSLISLGIIIFYFVRTEMFHNAPYMFYIRVITIFITIGLINLLPLKVWLRKSNKIISLFYILNFVIYLVSDVALLLYAKFNSTDLVVVSLDIVSSVVVMILLIFVIRDNLRTTSMNNTENIQSLLIE